MKKFSKFKRASSPVAPEPFGQIGYDKVKTAAEVRALVDGGLTTTVELFLDETLGLPASGKPDQDGPALPEDLSGLDNEHLADLHAQFILWQSYAGELLAAAHSRKTEIEVRMAQIGAKIRKRLNGTVTYKADVRDTDPAYALWADAYLRQSALVTMLEARYNKYDRYAAAVSRQITLRTSRT